MARRDERFIDEARQQFKAGRPVFSIIETHGLRRFERPPVLKGGQPHEERPLALGEQVVAPLDRRSHRFLALRPPAVACGKNVDRRGKSATDAGDSKHVYAGCGQLEGQRDPVEVTANRDDVAHVSVMKREAVVGRSHAIHEQLNGRIPGRVAYRVVAVWRRDVERWDAIDDFVCDVERFAARG